MSINVKEEIISAKVLTLISEKKVEKLLSEKRNELVPGEEWELICLLISSLARELASPYFIHERLHSWAPSIIEEHPTNFVLSIILRGLENLCTKGLAKKRDLRVLKACEEYQRYCSLHVTGLSRSPKNQRIPFVYKISENGTIQILDLLKITPEDRKYNPHKRVAAIIGR